MTEAINSELRTAALNRRYYGCRLAFVQRCNRWLDIIVAVSCAGTFAALWQSGWGVGVWKVFAAIASTFAVIKPFLRLGRDIERYAELSTGYAALYYDLKILTQEIRRCDQVTPQHWAQYIGMAQQMKELGISDDVPAKKRLHRRCYDEIRKEIPSEALWWPKEADSERSKEVKSGA